MTPHWQASDVTLYQGDARTMWQHMPEHSAHAIITSPPYFGLRDYGVDGQLGLEASPAEYIETLAGLLTAWGTSVLRPDGSMWLNLGDSYNNRVAAKKSAHQRGLGFDSDDLRKSWTDLAAEGRTRMTHSSVPEKCLLMIPERVALALIDRGWILRNKVAWCKPNGMPASVTDRLATKWEYLFHFTRQPRYWYDLDAIREPHAAASRGVGRRGLGSVTSGEVRGRPHGPNAGGIHEAGANPGDWWVIPTQPYPEAHFAVYPPELIRRPILATVPGHACKACGKGRERITERTPMQVRPGPSSGAYGSNTTDGINGTMLAPAESRTVGWSDCGCTAGWQAGTVADPFAGAGTTAVMARRLGRRSVLCELNADYCDLIRRRLAQDVLTFDHGDTA